MPLAAGECVPTGRGGTSYLCNFVTLSFYLCRYYQLWDYNPYNPLVGLVVAGGTGSVSVFSVKLNISQDLGKSAKTLTDIPLQYSCSSSNKYINGGCLVIINDTTIFTAGGEGE